MVVRLMEATVFRARARTRARARVLPLNGYVVCAVDTGVELRDWIKKTLNYEGEDLLIGGFSSRCDVTFGLYPPFDFVDVRTLDRKKMYIVPFDSCTFLLKPMQEV